MKYYAVVVFVLLSSCGENLVINPEPTDTYVNASLGEPIELTFDTRICSQDRRGTNFSVKTKLYSSIDNFNEYTVEYSSSLSSVYLGGEFEKRYYYNVKTKDLKIRTMEIEESKELKLCHDEMYDSSKTFESAGAMVYSTMKKTKDFLSKFNLKLPALKYLIAPKIKRVVVSRLNQNKHTESATLINNAYFDYGEQEIVFLPQGITNEGYIPFNGTPLWQIPFVPVHEYGHHIFSHLFPSYFETRLKGHKKLCFDNRSIKEFDHNVSDSLHRDIGTDLVYTAINEGFADLVSHYVINGETTLDGLSCLSKNRDVNNSKFLSGEDKILSEKSISVFLSPVKSKEQSCFNEVNFQDVHMVGAVVAYGFNKIMDTLGMTRERKMTTLFSWVKKLEDSHKILLNIKDEKKLLKKMLEIFLDYLILNHEITPEARADFLHVFSILNDVEQR